MTVTHKEREHVEIFKSNLYNDRAIRKTLVYLKQHKYI